MATKKSQTHKKTHHKPNWQLKAQLVTTDLGTRAKKLWQQIPSRWRQTPRLVAVGVVTIVILVGLTAVGIYELRWENGWASAVTRLTPLPAAYVDNSMISYHDYYGQVHVLGVYFKQLAKLNKKSAPNGRQVDQQALGQATNDILVQHYAEAHGITVSASEVTSELAKIYATEGGKGAVSKVLAQQYGMSVGGYSVIIKQQLLTTKVQAAVEKDPTSIEAGINRAETALTAIQKGGDFVAVEKQYSQSATTNQIDPSALVAVDTLPKAVGDAVAKVADGELVNQVVITPGANYVVKRVVSQGGKIYVEVIVTHPTSFSDWLLKQYQQVKIVKLLAQTR